ncbi:MAG: S8 family serine peptidase, partial [Pyrinomonadaceae bacterium]
MKRTKRSLAITWLTCSALILSLCSGILITENAGAAAKSDERPHGQRKVADDLQQQLNNSDETVQVILQLNGAVSKELAALLKSNGIKIKKHFSNFNSFAVELPAGVIEQLAMVPEVSFVSSDSPIQILGHLSSTTGADDVRQQSNASGGSYTLDGSGIGIAVLDSGIFASHKSFADAAGRSRVVYSQDFTGQNRVDDPFGHGTFVAGIAAGSSSIYRSDYTGVASNAKIINLRVLD